MTAFSDTTEIRCNGPGGEAGPICPLRSVEYSRNLTPGALRNFLALQGWESSKSEGGTIDRCPSLRQRHTLITTRRRSPCFA